MADEKTQHPAHPMLQKALQYIQSAMHTIGEAGDVPMPKGLKDVGGGEGFESAEKTLTGVIGAVPAAGVEGLARAGAEISPAVGAVRDIAADAAEIEKEIHAAADAAKAASKAKSASEVAAAAVKQDVAPESSLQSKGEKIWKNIPSTSETPAASPIKAVQGGHAGGGVASEEELARPGRFVKISKSGISSDQGKTPDFNLKQGEAGYQVKPDGSFELKAGQETPTTRRGVQEYLKEVYGLQQPAPQSNLSRTLNQ